VFPPNGSSRLAGLASEKGVGHEFVTTDDAAVVGMSSPKFVKIIGRTKIRIRDAEGQSSIVVSEVNSRSKVFILSSIY